MNAVKSVSKKVNVESFGGSPFVSFKAQDNVVKPEIYEIGGIKFKAFFDSAHKMLFVLDSTKDELLPNILLIIDDKDSRKWDDILQNDFGINPETVRPKIANKYQKLDIEYSGLNYYADAIVSDNAKELLVWRQGVSNGLRDVRVYDANHEIELARATINEANKTIQDLNEFISIQKDKLKAARKNVGKELPKESAAKILRYEGRIEKANAKKARASRRLKRAEKRIDSSLKMLNNYNNVQGRGIMADNDVRPLFTENPNIIDTENAFKPVSFGAVPVAAPAPQAIQPVQRPTIAPNPFARPASPMTGNGVRIEPAETPVRQQSGAYYLMLALLIGLSIFTLYLYQKKMASGEMPHIATVAGQVAPTEQQTVPTETTQPVVQEAAPEVQATGAQVNPFVDTVPTTPSAAVEQPQPVVPETPMASPEPVQVSGTEQQPVAVENTFPSAAPASEAQQIPDTLPEQVNTEAPAAAPIDQGSATAPASDQPTTLPEQVNTETPAAAPIDQGSATAPTSDQSTTLPAGNTEQDQVQAGVEE